MYIEQIYTKCLAQASYYIESEGEAIIIDPIREPQPYLLLAAKRGAVIKYLFETHFHADFVSGHLELANALQIPVVFGPGATTNYQAIIATDLQVFAIGKIKLQVLHTPGHTPESICLLLFDETNQPYAVFTGDTLFVGDVGRPDLAVKSDLTANDLAGLLYNSIQKHLMLLPNHVLVYPAHGAGSACGKNIGKETYSTIGQQKLSNYALQQPTKEAFVAAITNGIQAAPAYFETSVLLNKNGYTALANIQQKAMQLATPEMLKEALKHNNAIVLDVRLASDFAQGHIKGSLFIGLEGQFAIWAATLISLNKSIYIVAANETMALEAATRLARVGFEHILGYISFDSGSIGKYLEIDNIVQSSPSEAAEWHKKGMPLVDVRKISEFNNNKVIGAINLSLDSLPEKLNELPQKPFLIHCAGGYRSLIAASIIKQQTSFEPIDVIGGFAAMEKTGNFAVETADCPL